MAALSTAVAIVGSAAPATIQLISSSNANFGASSVQQISLSGAHLRSPATNFHSSKRVAIKAIRSSNEERSHKVMVTLVAAGAALILNLTPVSPAHAEPFGSDTVKVERGATAPDFPGKEGTGIKMGDNSGVRDAANSGSPLGEGNLNTGSGLKVPDVGNSVGDAVRRKVEGAKEMTENAKSTVNGVPDAATAASEVVSSEGAGDVRGAAAEVARNAAQSVVTDSAQQLVDGAKSGLSNPLEALMSKITGK